MARAKAFLIKGVEIRWSCDPSLLPDDDSLPEKAVISFPGGILDYLKETLGERPTYTQPFTGTVPLPDEGRVEWAVAWPGDERGFINSYVNTVPTPQGGSHEQGLRTALTRGLRTYAELTGVKKTSQITADDVMDGACVMLSVFIANPQFQGQTKERLGMPEAQRAVENSLKDHFEHLLW